MNESTKAKSETKIDFGKERIEILYEDDALCVIFKPSGMLSVPYPGSRAKTAIATLEQIMRKKGTFSSSHRPFVVHRLDRDTSGVMMFAMTENAQKKIMDSWQTMVTERLYRAVAENPQNGHFLPAKGTIDAEIAYNAHNIGFVPKSGDEPDQFSAKKALKEKKSHDGTAHENSIYSRNLSLKNGHAEFKTISAVTHYKIVAAGSVHTMFELSLETGRKNQIRAHLASKGYPLAGDENYRAKTDPFGRLALHARTLEFDHPYTGKHMKFEIPEPEEWLETVNKGSGNIRPIWDNSGAGKKHSASSKKISEKDSRRSSHTEHKMEDIYAETKRQMRPTGRQMAGMDFIQKGKLHR